MTDMDTMMFFEGHSSALPLYEALEAKLYALYPNMNKRVQKTQITFSNRRVFACVSFLRAGKKSELPDPYIVVTLGLPRPPASRRVAVKTEPNPGRWTVHIVAGRPEEIDDELLSWIEQAYVFAEIK